MIDSVEKSALELCTFIECCTIFACFRRCLKYMASFTNCFNQSQLEGSVEYFSDTLVIYGKRPLPTSYGSTKYILYVTGIRLDRDS